MARIGEPDAVGAVDSEIAGLVVVLVVEQRIDSDQPPVRRELDQPASALLRAVKLAARTMSAAARRIWLAAPMPRPKKNMTRFAKDVLPQIKDLARTRPNNAKGAAE